MFSFFLCSFPRPVGFGVRLGGRRGRVRVHCRAHLRLPLCFLSLQSVPPAPFFSPSLPCSPFASIARLPILSRSICFRSRIRIASCPPLSFSLFTFASVDLFCSSSSSRHAPSHRIGWSIIYPFKLRVRYLTNPRPSRCPLDQLRLASSSSNTGHAGGSWRP